jgi:hypothetical protein
MKTLKYMALLSTLALLFPLSSFARDKNERTVTISDPVQIGSTQLKPGNYRVEWQGTGSNAQVNFMHNGKTVATAPATVKTDDPNVTQDDVVIGTNNNPKALREIDFHHDKAALIFQQSGM